MHGRRASNGSVTDVNERRSTVTEREHKRRGEKFDIPFDSSLTAHIPPVPSPPHASAYHQSGTYPASPTDNARASESEGRSRKQGSEGKSDNSPRAVLQEMKMKKLRELEQKSHVR